MSKDYLMRWFHCAFVRSIRTIAQTFLATIGTSVVLSDVDWRMVVSASILAGIISIVTSLTGLPEVKYEDIGEE